MYGIQQNIPFQKSSASYGFWSAVRRTRRCGGAWRWGWRRHGWEQEHDLWNHPTWLQLQASLHVLLAKPKSSSDWGPMLTSSSRLLSTGVAWGFRKWCWWLPMTQRISPSLRSGSRDWQLEYPCCPDRLWWNHASLKGNGVRTSDSPRCRKWSRTGGA